MPLAGNEPAAPTTTPAATPAPTPAVKPAAQPDAAQPTAPATTTPVTVVPAPKIVPTAAVVVANGRRQVIGLHQEFTLGGTTFRLVSVDPKQITIAVADASFAGGAKQITLDRKKQVSLENAATGVRYSVVFRSATNETPTTHARRRGRDDDAKARSHHDTTPEKKGRRDPDEHHETRPRGPAAADSAPPRVRDAGGHHRRGGVGRERLGGHRPRASEADRPPDLPAPARRRQVDIELRRPDLLAHAVVRVGARAGRRALRVRAVDERPLRRGQRGHLVDHEADHAGGVDSDRTPVDHGKPGVALLACPRGGRERGPVGLELAQPVQHALARREQPRLRSRHARRPDPGKRRPRCDRLDSGRGRDRVRGLVPEPRLQPPLQDDDDGRGRAGVRARARRNGHRLARSREAGALRHDVEQAAPGLVRPVEHDLPHACGPPPRRHRSRCR